MLSLVSTWMGDRLGTLGAVGYNFSSSFSSCFGSFLHLQLYKSVRVIKVVKNRQGCQSRQSRQFHQSWNQLYCYDVQRPLRLFHIHHCTVKCNERSSMFRKTEFSERLHAQDVKLCLIIVV